MTDNKRLEEALCKVREGKAAFFNLSSCEIESDKVKPYYTKDGDKFLVDKELDVRLLDKINANKNIELENVCSGHNKEPPKLGFNYIGKQSISNIKEILSKLPDSEITYNSQLIRTAVPLKDEFKIKRDGEEYTLCEMKEVHQDYFFIKGKRIRNKTWWNKVSNTLSDLR